MTVSAGTRLGPYELLAPLRAGGMGEVYRARDTRLGREVAIKVLATGRREPWKTIVPQDPAGIWMADLMLTPDGKSYAYNCKRNLNDLYLVEGLK